jgi:spore coat polysaccharide biosynthesis protein SpsF (cytidylyltransferase family)
LVDPEVCGQVLRLLRDSGSDLACNNMPPSWPYGLDCEAFLVSWLERAAREAVNPFDREHVTPYIRSHPEARKANLVGPGGAVARQRWAVDHPEDLEFMRNIFAQLPRGPEGYDYRYPLRLLGCHVPPNDRSAS